MAELKSSIEHLPERARGDLARLVEILHEEFASAIADRKAPRLRDGKILKIVLFGSYARGTQVVDPVGRYFSDYDLLVVVDHEDLTDTFEYWAMAEERMLKEMAQGEWPQPFNLIVHSLDDVNYKLRLGRYFFIDMIKDGIALFELPGFPLDESLVLEEAEAKSEAQDFFDDYFTAAVDARKGVDAFRSIGNPKWAAFMLHQSAEAAYYCLLLVIKLYMPKSHNLNFLSGQCEQIDSRLIGIWQKDSKFGQRCYELLRAAYIKARYSKHYKITDEELDWLSARIDELHALTKVICEERLAKI
ncbi:HEPN domain-containing protein [Sphingobium boeckii]|uniref:Putative nucleotidyltransferase/HEPN domain-containing protein n=1 Tax=Sphingobium boeckii TaxID=1082345 RepID=A0A7W9AG40_9SPHN|nr:HEPN domain-containing protein [Sphingobium boeckii]MBB5684975.1 putative nucleotidyltransferase/HEPN domain-containing protein [Sphingobium boeckii]